MTPETRILVQYRLDRAREALAEARCLFRKFGTSRTSCPRRRASSPRSARPLDSRFRGHDARLQAVYQRPYSAAYPLVWIAETRQPQVQETRQPPFWLWSSTRRRQHSCHEVSAKSKMTNLAVERAKEQ
jgi:hypothetical protein